MEKCKTGNTVLNNLYFFQMCSRHQPQFLLLSNERNKTLCHHCQVKTGQTACAIQIIIHCVINPLSCGCTSKPCVTHSPSFGLLWWLDSFSLQIQLISCPDLSAVSFFFLLLLPTITISIFLFLQSAHCWLSVLFIPSNVFILFSWPQLAEKTPNLRIKCELWEAEYTEDNEVWSKNHEGCLLWNSQLRTTSSHSQRDKWLTGCDSVVCFV